ncbi:MAG: helix-turn-helix domain-containing protein [Phenylobacterium sp.]
MLKALRQRRRVSPPDMARTLGLSLRAYENFESGKGRLNVDRIHAFADALGADPFAILAAFEIDSPRFALNTARNKFMMIFMMALGAFDAKAEETIVHLDPLTLMDAFSAMFDDLALKAQAQADLINKLRHDDPPGGGSEPQDEA